MILAQSRERNRFLKFALVGIVGAVVDFGLFNILSAVLHFEPFVAQIISFMAAVANNFIWNRYWTYPDSRTKQVSAQMGQFLLVSLIGLAIRSVIYYVLEPFLIQSLAGMPRVLPVQTVQIAHNITLAFAIVVVMLWNFFANRYWTYNDCD